MNTPILNHWTRSDDEKKQAALSLSVKRLKAAADAYMVEAAQAKLDAEAALAAALVKAEKEPDFGAIVDASLRVKRAEFTYKEAASVYSTYFDMAPTV